MKKTLTMFTILAVSGLFLASNLFGEKLLKTDACTGLVSGDPCSYTKSDKKVIDGTCMARGGQKHKLICAKNRK